MDDKAKITSVARRALQLLKNRSFAELAEISSASIKAQMYELTSQPPDHTSWFFESEDGQAVLRWNGVLSPDVLFEATDSTIYAQVLFAKEVQQDDELNTERFFFVRLVSEGDEWRFLQTACANGEEVREHTARAKTSIKEAKEAYRSSLVSESEYEAEQRREAALVAVQGAMGGVWRLAAMLGLNAEQFVACAKDICMPYGGAQHIIDIVQAIHDLNALTS